MPVEMPKILQGAASTEHRTIRIPSFEVDARLASRLLDPNYKDRIAVRIEVSVEGSRPEPTIKPIRDESRNIKGYILDETTLVYQSAVVPGSPTVTGYEPAPEQMVLEVAPVLQIEREEAV